MLICILYEIRDFTAICTHILRDWIIFKNSFSIISFIALFTFGCLHCAYTDQTPKVYCFTFKVD